MPSVSQWLFDTYRLDPNNTVLWHGDQMVPLRPKTFALLSYLVEHTGQLVRKDTLLNVVWPETTVSDAVLKTCIGEIRKALNDSAQSPQFIATVYRRGYRFIMPVTPVSQPVDPPDLPHPARPLTPPTPSMPAVANSAPAFLVSREAELAQLQQWLHAALQGQRQIGFITGEPGIGKTALIDTFINQLTTRQLVDGINLRIGFGHCIEQYGASEAYLPLLEALGHLGRAPEVIEVFYQHAPSWLPQMPAWTPPQDDEPLPQKNRSVTPERMLRELTRAVEILAADHLLILVLEDLHWSDVSTLDWLTHIARRRTPARLLVLGTYRPVETMIHSHPLRSVTQELRMRGYCEECSLTYLSEAGTAAYLAQRFGTSELPPRFSHALHRRSNGNPLFLVNIIDDAVRQGVLQKGATGWTLAADLDVMESGVPENLRQLIEQQLIQLDPEDQEILQAASVTGMIFSVAAVAAGVRQPLEHVEARCAMLARRDQFLKALGTTEWADGTIAESFGFIHALYQETLYHHVTTSRRVRWHRDIGLRQEAGYASQTRDIAADLAWHFVQARDAQRAVHYLELAAEKASHRHAHRETVDYLTQALNLLRTWPDTPDRSQRELALHNGLGPALITTKGYTAPEVQQSYARSRALCQDVGDTSQLFSVLSGLAFFYLQSAELSTALEIGQELLTLAEQPPQELAHLIVAHQVLGMPLFWRGELDAARHHLEAALRFYHQHGKQMPSFRYGEDPGITCRIYLSRVLWMLGYADEALDSINAALALAAERQHPFSLAYAQSGAAFIHQLRREAVLAQHWAQEAIAICVEYEFPFVLAWSRILRGLALVSQGQSEEGLSNMQQGLADHRALGANLGQPYLLSLLASAYIDSNRPVEGLRTLQEAQAMADQSGERLYEPERYRLNGLLRQPLTIANTVSNQLDGPPSIPSTLDEVTDAETAFLNAKALARQQNAKALELRVTLSLSRFWQQKGNTAAAHQVLHEVCHGFTETVETADYQEAIELLTYLQD